MTSIGPSIGRSITPSLSASIGGQKKAILLGAGTDFISTPAVSVTSSHIAGGYIQFDDNTPSSFEGIIRKHESAGNQRGFEFNIASPSGFFALNLSSAGSNNEGVSSTQPVGIADGTGFWAFYVYDAATPDVTFYTSLASPVASISDMFDVADVLGDVVPVTAASIFNNNSDVKMGAASNGFQFRGFIVLGTDPTATPEISFNANDYVHGDTLISQETGETYTLNGTVTIQSA